MSGSNVGISECWTATSFDMSDRSAANIDRTDENKGQVSLLPCHKLGNIDMITYFVILVI